jgi:hypothetical protein
MAPNLARPMTRPVHREWIDEGRPHLPANTVDGGFDNEALHGQMAAILAAWRPGHRILFAFMLISTAPAGCTVGPDFVAPSQPRTTNYVMGQAATASTQASGDTTQQIYLGGVLEADWWTGLRSPELDRTVTLALSSNRTRRWCACRMEGEMPPAPARHVIARGRRSDLGRPAASIRFRTAAPIAPSFCWAAKPRARNRGPISAL